MKQYKYMWLYHLSSGVYRIIKWQPQFLFIFYFLCLHFCVLSIQGEEIYTRNYIVGGDVGKYKHEPYTLDIYIYMMHTEQTRHTMSKQNTGPKESKQTNMRILVILYTGTWRISKHSWYSLLHVFPVTAHGSIALH